MRLARETIETYVRTGRKICVPDGLPQEMYDRRAGVFVSLKKDGRLRGCIGDHFRCAGQHCRRDHRKCRQCGNSGSQVFMRWRGRNWTALCTV